MADNESYLYQV